MVKRRKRALWLISAVLTGYVLIVVAVPTRRAEAIPAFARKYGFSCSTCHAPVPRLKAYGEDFAGNGFQLPDDQEPIRAFRETGDETLLLQRELPVGVRFDVYYAHGMGNTEFSDLQAPWALKFLSGGNVAPDIGYYFYFYLSERGEVAGIEDAYIHFNNLGGLPLDVMLGQFQISDPLMKRELRLTYEDYQVYRVRPGASMTNLTYDRGAMITYDTPFGLGLVGQIVNGNGKPEAGANRIYDADRDKGYSLRGAYELGPLMLGGFWYATREQITLGGAPFENEVSMLGPDLVLGLMEGNLTFTGQYLRRTDSNPGFGLNDAETTGMVAELTWLPQGEDGRWAAIALYNQVTSDDAVVEYETATFSASYLLRRNLRLMAEYTRDLALEADRIILGFVSGF